MGYATSTEQAAEHARGFLARPGATLLVAVVEDAVVGMAASFLVPRLDVDVLSCRITDLVVAAASRRRGIGRELMVEIETRARDAGATRLDLSTGDWRGEAHAFYEHLGFIYNARALLRRIG
jgi:GNAT superfamily N-acetyltransferase